MFLYNGQLCFNTYKCNNSETGLVNTWTYNNFLIIYDPENNYNITSVSIINKEIIFSTNNTFTQNYKRTYFYSSTNKEDVEESYSGTYSLSDNKVVITYSDDLSTAELLLNGEDLFTTLKMGLLTSIATPRNLTATNTTENSVSLQWSAVTGAQKYKVYYGTTESNLTYIGETTECEFVINNLTANTNYYFSVSAYNGWAEGLKCSVMSKKTAEPPSLQFTINDEMDNPFDISLNCSSTVLIRNSPFNVKATSEITFDEYRWYLNDVLLPNQTTNICNFNDGLIAGRYQVSLIVRKDKQFDTKEIEVIVPDQDYIEKFENDLPTLWTSDTTTTWYRTSGESYQGLYSLRSGSIGSNNSTSVSIIGSGSTVSFYAKVASEERYDKLIFYIDGVKKMEISGNKDWQKYEYTTTFGTHTFKWVYVKDVSDLYETYSDCAWIDNICIAE